MTPITIATLLFSLLASVSANAQPAMPAAKRICMDVAHDQKFWHDPADMAGMDVKMIERVKYMTAELTKTATAVSASLSYPGEGNHTQGRRRVRPRVHPHSFGQIHTR